MFTDHSTFTVHTEYHHSNFTRSGDDLGSVVEDFGCIANQNRAAVPDDRSYTSSPVSSSEAQALAINFSDSESEVSSDRGAGEREATKHI